MYDTMMKNFADQMAPFTKVAEINKKTTEKLFELQSAYMTEMFNAGMTQFKALTGATEPKSAVEMQIAFYKEMEAKLTAAAEQEVAALSSAREELTSVFEESMAAIADADYLKEMGNFDLAAMMPSTEKKTRTARKAAAPKA
jgi:hypothetical protein